MPFLIQLRRVLPIWLLACAWPVLSTSQTRAENTLLWEIIHPVSQKSSYLFATVHRNDSLVLQVDATLLGCLKRCDVVALESDPSKWQAEYTKDPLIEFGWPTNQGPAISYLHPADFQLPEYRKTIEHALTQIPSFAANWMRYSPGRAVPVLDVLLYQTAIRLQKSVIELESDNDRQRLIEPASRTPDNGLPLSENVNSADHAAPWNLSYLQGNLLGFTVDGKLQIAEKDKPLLIQRNQLFLQHIKPLLQEQSAFIAVGAAHIPGKHGLLEQLRAAGFRINPLAFNRQISLVEASQTIPLPPKSDSLFQYHDEGFELRSTERLYHANSAPLYPLRQYTDITTGQIFVAGRIATGARFRGLTPEDILKQIKADIQAVPELQLRYASDTLVRTQPAWHIILQDHYGMWQERLLIVGLDGCWILGWHGAQRDRQRASAFFAGFATTRKPNQQLEWSQFRSTGARGTVSLWHQVTTDARGTSKWRIKHTLAEPHQLSSDSLQLRLAEKGWSKGIDIATAGTPRFTQYLNHLVLENTYQTITGLQWKVRFLRSGPTIWIWINQASNVDGIAAFDGFPEALYLAPEILKPQTDSALGFRMKVISSVSSAAQTVQAKQTLAAGGTVFRRYELIGDRTIQLQVVPLDAYQQWPDSAVFLQNEIERLQQQPTSSIQVVESTAQPQKHQWKINLMLTHAGSNNVIYQTSWLSGRRIYRLSINVDTLLNKAADLFTAFNSFEPIPPVAPNNSIFDKLHTLFWADYFSANTARANRARLLLGYMKFFPGDLAYLEKAWKRASTVTAYAGDRKSLIQHLSRLETNNHQPATRLARWFHTVKQNDTLRSTILLELARLANPTASDWLWKLDSTLYPSLTGEYTDIDWSNYLQTGLPNRLRYLPQIRNEVLTLGGRLTTWKLLYQLQEAGLLQSSDHALLEPAIQRHFDSVWNQLLPKWNRRRNSVQQTLRWFHGANFSQLTNLLAHCPNANQFIEQKMNEMPASEAWWIQVYYWPARWKLRQQIDTEEWNTLRRYTAGRWLVEEQTAKSQGKWLRASNDSALREQGKWLIYACLTPRQMHEPQWVKDTTILGSKGFEHWLLYTITTPESTETTYALTRAHDPAVSWMDHNVFLLPKTEQNNDAQLNEWLNRILASSQPQVRLFFDPEAYRAGSWAN